MADCCWAPEKTAEFVVLPAAVADDCLAAAGGNQLKVLLWLSRHRMEWDEAACAEALGLPPEVCAAGRQFWMDRGILLAAPGETRPAAPKPAGRPAPVKPQLREVLAYQRQHPEFASLLEDVSARLGKPLGHGDTATLLYLLDTVGLPPHVILTEVVYAVSIGRGNMRYIEKLALDWADQELTTLEAVDEHIRYLERCRTAAARVETLLELPRPLSAAHACLAEKWLEQWHVREDMLIRAAAITTEKTGRLTVPYMDKILERWQAEGIDAPEKIPATAARKKGAAATNPEESSLDLAQLDEQLQRYTPVFGQKT